MKAALRLRIESYVQLCVICIESDRIAYDLLWCRLVGFVDGKNNGTKH